MKPVGAWIERVGSLAFLGLVLACLSPFRALAQDCQPRIGRAVSVQGTVEVRRSGESGFRALPLDDELCTGDTVRAGANSRADLALLDQSVMRIRAGTELTLSGVRSDETSLVDLLRGTAHFLTRGGTRLEVNTPFSVAGVRGTEFQIEVGPDATLVSVLEGDVLDSNAAGELTLTSGESALARRGEPPRPVLVARPRDAVRWALYYPPVLYVQPEVRAEDPPWLEQMRRSSEAYLRGDLAQAFEGIEGIGEPAESDPRFLTYRASLHLAIGGVEQAEADLARALSRTPEHAGALALRSVLAVVADQRESALDLAQRALAAAPRESAPRIALSYAHQAQFDLEAAQRALEEAVALEPENALAWARLAEIRSSQGDLDGALVAAERAAELAPGLSRTHAVRGFALLTHHEPDEAQTSFERAIALDSADPLPRLGLGLARIRRGNLAEGARELEVAASLDPGNALVRSYLGKAYFEEKRDGLDLRELETAKQLDPQDPTPWLYAAIAKQTRNRPVEALADLNRAIELNDRRGVYRSRLLLDSDLAARSASLGRIYSDLGFQSLALVEGWRSLEADPSNYSAHRLLADSYAALPRHEIARVSELLQSQLLQPANLTPIQPRLAESNLFLLASQGPSNLSFNEFNPLFNRDGPALQGGGLLGQDDTQTGEGVASAIQGPLSLSAGYSGYTTDGFRTNNDQDDRIANAFAQYELSPATSVQVEARHRHIRNGDLELRFFEDDFSRFSDEETTTYSFRTGLRQSFSPQHTVLLSYIHQRADTAFSDFIPDPLFGDFSIDVDLDETGNSGEAQYLYRSEPLETFGPVRSVNAILGLGHFDVDVEEETLTQIDISPFPPIVELLGRDPDVTHSNGYLYSTLDLTGDVALTLGVSIDGFDEDDGVGDEGQVNPKAGLSWSPPSLPGTRLRTAAFRTLKRTLITDQTLEPTQVAGFNQFFDDPSATQAWRYGVAIDQTFSERVFGGVELSRRDLDTPQGVFGAGGFVSQEVDWEENLARAYLFVTPCDQVSLRAEYRYERFERDPFADAFGTEIFFAFERVKTHTIPVGVQFFHPTGFGAALGATWIHQDGDFFRDDTQTLQDGDRKFWVLDAALRYRLPRRYGFVSFGVNNLLDEDDTYQATDVRNPSLRPGRFAFGSITLAFP